MNRETSLVPAFSDTLALTRAEIDSQISTAKMYPRDLKSVISNAMAMVDLVATQKSTREGGEELFYALPRGGKLIQGPSVRLAEIIQHCYGNCRAGARQVSEDATHIVLQGVFHDLETNSAVTFEIKRRITRKDGTRYDDDMIGITSNAGCGIAYRNAVLKGIPKAIWLPLYERARKIAGGSAKPKEVLASAKTAIDFFSKKGVPVAAILKVLGVETPRDITTDGVATLKGIAEAIRSGETTVAAAFGLREENGDGKVRDAEVVDDKDKPIGKNQAQDIWVMLTDAGLGESDLKKALKQLKHSGDLESLPVSKCRKLIDLLNSGDGKKKSGRLF